MRPIEPVPARPQPLRWVVRLVGLGLVVAIAAQLQHLAWSTARVKNDSPDLLTDVRLYVNTATVNVGILRPGGVRLVRLPDRGDATLSVEFAARDNVYRGCREYVEGDMYHVRVSVSPALAVSCRAELGVLTGRVMLLEYW